MTGKGIVYPITVSEYDDDGHYFVATFPNIPGMVIQGDTLSEVAYWAEDAIATMIAGADYPTHKLQLIGLQEVMFQAVRVKI